MGDYDVLVMVLFRKHPLFSSDPNGNRYIGETISTEFTAQLDAPRRDL
jgi:hypothetical protein